MKLVVALRTMFAFGKDSLKSAGVEAEDVCLYREIEDISNVPQYLRYQVNLKALFSTANLVSDEREQTKLYKFYNVTKNKLFYLPLSENKFNNYFINLQK